MATIEKAKADLQHNVSIAQRSIKYQSSSSGFVVIEMSLFSVAKPVKMAKPRYRGAVDRLKLFKCTEFG